MTRRARYYASPFGQCARSAGQPVNFSICAARGQGQGRGTVCERYIDSRLWGQPMRLASDRNVKPRSRIAAMNGSLDRPFEIAMRWVVTMSVVTLPAAVTSLNGIWLSASRARCSSASASARRAFAISRCHRLSARRASAAARSSTAVCRGGSSGGTYRLYHDARWVAPTPTRPGAVAPPRSGYDARARCSRSSPSPGARRPAGSRRARPRPSAMRPASRRS